MSVQNEIDRIAGAKTTLGSYLQQNGVPVPEGATLDTMALLLADVIEKQDKITASGILQGDGNGGVSAAETVEGTASTVPSGLLKGSGGAIVQATAGTDYMPPVPVTAADNGKAMKVVNGAWAKATQNTETWTFTLADGSTVTKSVVLA